MKRKRTYAKAPITEAIIDLAVEPQNGVILADLANVLRGRKKVRYPRRSSITKGTGRFTLGKSFAAETTQTAIGFAFISADEKQVLQVRMDGFTLSRLAPYGTWGTFRREARILWSEYRRMAQPKRVARVAVRYVNRLDLPLPINDLKEYLTTVPEIGPEIDQGLEHYFMHVTIPLGDIRSTLVLQETIIDSPDPSRASIVLDIDIARTENIPQDDDKLWSLFDELRRAKNHVFEACITDKTRELIS